MNTPEQRSDEGLEFRPVTYFWPESFTTRLLHRIQGAERRREAQRYIEQGRVDELPAFLAKAALDPKEREMFGRVHPDCLGGEFLPTLEDGEVEILRCTIRSTTQDVTSVYARPGKNSILYRVADEYGGDTLQGPDRLWSRRPLTLGKLVAFFDRAWPIYEVLEMNFLDYEIGSVGEMLHFVRGFDSEFYPGIDALYRGRIRAWATKKLAELGRDPDGKELEEEESNGFV